MGGSCPNKRISLTFEGWVGELIFRHVRLHLPTGTLDMADSQLRDSQLRAESCLWSNRILSLAVAGILFLTLYPFRFSSHANGAGNASPFLLVSGGKGSGLFAAFLNVLLFVPFGFGLAQKLREKGNSGAKALLLTMAAGAFFSYSIEFLQIFIPTRDSGWEDVFTNTTGSVVGCLISALFGGFVLGSISNAERGLDRFLTTHRALWIIPLYFAIWFALSVPLQEESRLSNWVPDSRVLIGNDASGRLDHAWKGEVSLLQFWNRSLPANLATETSAQKLNSETEPSALATYVFSGSSPFEDKKKFLPELTWTPGVPDALDNDPIVLTGRSWISSKAPIPNLVEAFREAKSFSVRLICTPAEVEGSDGRILSISGENGIANLSLRQHDSDLIVWLRNRLSVRRDQLSLTIPDVFVLHQPRDILLSYDGSNLSVYLDGKGRPRLYELTPGASLAQLIRHIKTAELEGYTYIYYALVFVPAGVLLGIVMRRITLWSAIKVLGLVMALGVPALGLELLLVRVSGRTASFGNVLLSLSYAIGGVVWINLDRQRRSVPVSGGQTKSEKWRR
jgi:glycopeptide antibiotics resistance protein